MTKFLAFVGLLAILGAIAAAIFFFGGYYNVAGTAAEPEFVKWALSHIRDASIERHAKDDPPASLNDPASVRAGARAFSERGCVNCHGGPGVDWANSPKDCVQTLPTSRNWPTRPRRKSCFGSSRTAST